LVRLDTHRGDPGTRRRTDTLQDCTATDLKRACSDLHRTTAARDAPARI